MWCRLCHLKFDLISQNSVEKGKTKLMVHDFVLYLYILGYRATMIIISFIMHGKSYKATYKNYVSKLVYTAT